MPICNGCSNRPCTRFAAFVFFFAFCLCSNHARGKRQTGLWFKMLNFNAEVYAEQQGDRRLVTDHSADGGFALVGTWRLESSVVLCSDEDRAAFGCRDIVYNTASGKNAPAESPAPIILYMPLGGLAVVALLGCIALICSLSFSAFLYKYRASKIIKSSQPEMLQIIAFGGVLSSIKAFVGCAPITDVSCQADAWLGHAAFCFVMTTLLLKSWRIDRIVNNKTLIRVRITLEDVLKRVFGIIGAFICYMIVFSVVGDRHASFYATEESNQVTKIPRCALVFPQFELTLFCMEAVILIYGIQLSYATKNVPAALNESKSIAQCTRKALCSSLCYLRRASFQSCASY